MELPKQYEPKQVEEKIYKIWEKSGFFKPRRISHGLINSKQKENLLHCSSPAQCYGRTAYGPRFKCNYPGYFNPLEKNAGFKTLWLPGTDHAGIATQNVVEKKLKKEGRFDLGREKFIEEVWEWKEKYGNIILNQFKKMGCSCDWSRTRFTMDEEYTEAVKEAFLHYYKKGLIYRGKRVVNWCPRCQTSLSDLELEYKEEKGNLWYIKYPIKKHSTG